MPWRSAASSRAALEDALERALRIDRDRGPEHHFGIHDAIEDHGARGFRIATRIVLRDARAVGVAVEIDALIPERCRTRSRSRTATLVVYMRRSDFFDELVAAFDVGGPHFHFVDALEKILITVVAIEPVRAAGAALVHQDDVAVAAHAIERPRGRGVQVHRRCARAARDEEQRVGLLVETDGRDARDEQLDRASVGLVGIFGNR